MASRLKSLIRSAFAFILLITCVQVDAQFFTKSSKSIPRMGRRSEDSGRTIEQLRHSLIDRLLDEFGPSLIENLEAKQVPDKSQELYYENYQPVDWKHAPGADVGGAMVIPTGSSQLSRDERSSATTKQRSAKDASIALRALNANRYIQYLASGQPPMSFDRVMNLQDPLAYKQTNYNINDK